MFIFIRNVARDYAWGDTAAIPAMLGEDETGAPQAELWLGTHVDDPAELAHSTDSAATLLDLIQGDVDKYGVDGAGLPFLLKVLGIGQPLSVQAHPNKAQAVEGFDRENALGIPRDSAERNYRDPNHKPEVVVALSDDFAALAGFRPLDEVVGELRLLAGVGDEIAEPLADIADWLGTALAGDEEAARADFMNWVFSGVDEVQGALSALQGAVAVVHRFDRQSLLRELFELYPGDPGILVSLLMNLVRLRGGEALYLPPQHIHAYLSGVAIEVMASSDNVLRAGLTPKHIDAAELCRVLDFGVLDEPRIAGVVEESDAGAEVTLWQPAVPDFSLRRVRLTSEAEPVAVKVAAEYPLVLICTEGKIIAERSDDGLDEFANLARGQALYVSAGEQVSFTGNGELFIATVGGAWGK